MKVLKVFFRAEKAEKRTQIGDRKISPHLFLIWCYIEAAQKYFRSVTIFAPDWGKKSSPLVTNSKDETATLVGH